MSKKIQKNNSTQEQKAELAKLKKLQKPQVPKAISSNQLALITFQVLLNQLKTKGSQSKLQLLKFLPPDILDGFIAHKVLIPEKDIYGLTRYKVNDELFE